MPTGAGPAGAARWAWIEALRSRAELIGAIAALLGIVFLVVQTIELRKQNAVVIESLAQAYRQDTFDKTLAFDEFVVEHAYLYEMVTAGPRQAAAQQLRASLDQAEVRAQAEAVAVHILDFYDYILLGYPVETYPGLGWVDSDLPGYSRADAEGFLAWSAAVRDTFLPGSYLCTVYKAKKKSYGASTFVARIDAAHLC